MKLNRKVASVLLAVTMFAGVLSVPAMADETDPAPTLDPVSAITKVVEKPANVYAPAATYTFTITPMTEVSGVGGNSPAGGLVFAEATGVTVSENKTEATISTSANDTTLSDTKITVGSLSFTVNENLFVHSGTTVVAPGVYRYKIVESGVYEGMTYDTAERYVDVAIDSDGEVLYTTVVKLNEKDEAVKDDGVVTNVYGKDSDGESTLHSLTVSKTVAGNQGDKNLAFEFSVKVEGQANEKYYVTVTSANGQPSYETLDTGVEAKISLKNGESFTINGLSASDKYTIDETARNDNGYTTTIDGNTVTAERTGTIITDTIIAYTNTKNATTPTGLLMDVAPYAAMILLAAAAAFVFLRRRNSNED